MALARPGLVSRTSLPAAFTRRSRDVYIPTATDPCYFRSILFPIQPSHSISSLPPSLHVIRS